jgi:hypothetical protein
MRRFRFPNTVRLPSQKEHRFAEHTLALNLSRDSGLQWMVDAALMSAFVEIEDLTLEVFHRIPKIEVLVEGDCIEFVKPRSTTWEYGAWEIIVSLLREIS